jgi:hypothetical protein
VTDEADDESVLLHLGAVADGVLQEGKASVATRTAMLRLRLRLMLPVVRIPNLRPMHIFFLMVSYFLV